LLDEIGAKKNGNLLSLTIAEKIDSIKVQMNTLSSNSIRTAVIDEPTANNGLLQ
jgi:hypothetical protein